MAKYRGFWREYWWVCLGSLVIPAIGAWLNWVPQLPCEKTELVPGICIRQAR
jgi:hypothetical protein